MSNATTASLTRLDTVLRRMVPEDALVLGRQLCEQLGSSPEQCHGGIWPGNIFLTESGAALLGAPVQMAVNVMPPEEVEFMSPEYFWENERSAAADVYSVGLVLFAAATGGRLPFQRVGGGLSNEERAKALRRRMKGDAVPLPKNVDSELTEIIQKAVAYEPADRYATPAEMAGAITEALKTLRGEKEPASASADSADTQTAAAAAAAAAQTKTDGRPARKKKKKKTTQTLNRMLLEDELARLDGEGAVSAPEEEALSEEMASDQPQGAQKPAAPMPMTATAEDLAAETFTIEESTDSSRRRVLRVLIPVAAVAAAAAVAVGLVVSRGGLSAGTHGDTAQAPLVDTADTQTDADMVDDASIVIPAGSLPTDAEDADAADANGAVADDESQDAAEKTADDETEAEKTADSVVAREQSVVSLPAAAVVTPDMSIVAPNFYGTPVPTATPKPARKVTEYSSADGTMTIYAADVSWETAQERCTSAGGTLAIIRDEEDFETACALAEKLGKSYVWLGASLGEDGIWYWEDGSVLAMADSHWGTGEPNGSDYDPPENRLMLIRENGVWVYNDAASAIYESSDLYGSGSYLISWS